MKLITDVYNVIKDANNTSDTKKIFRVLEIDLSDYSMVIPSMSYSYLNAIMLSTVKPGEIDNYIINGNKKSIAEVPGVTTVDEDTFRYLAAELSSKAKIENLTHLLDFLRQNKSTLLTTKFERRKRALTIDGDYNEIPGIYSSYFSNIRYSSKDLGISVPYVVNGTVTQSFSGESMNVKRLVSASIINNDGEAIKNMDIILSLDCYEIFKTKIDLNDLYEIENGLINGDTAEATYVASKLPNNSFLVSVNTEKLLDYTPIRRGTIDILCHPAVIQDTLYKLNSVVRMIKAYRGGNTLIKNALSIDTTVSEESIYDIPPLENTTGSNLNTTIEFYLKGKKAVPSYKKLLNAFIDFTEYESSLATSLYNKDIAGIKNTIEDIKRSLGVPVDYDILNEDLLLNNSNRDAVFPLIAYSAFLNSVNVIDTLENKLTENYKKIAQLESMRETLKARLAHVRYCLNAKGKLPLKQRDGVVIAVANAPHITF